MQDAGWMPAVELFHPKKSYFFREKVVHRGACTIFSETLFSFGFTATEVGHMDHAFLYHWSQLC
jgi:hypothetical protein